MSKPHYQAAGHITVYGKAHMDARKRRGHGEAERQEKALRRHGAQVPGRLGRRRRHVRRLLRPAPQPPQRQEAQEPLRQPRLPWQRCRVSRQRRTVMRIAWDTISATPAITMRAWQ